MIEITFFVYTRKKSYYNFLLNCHVVIISYLWIFKIFSEMSGPTLLLHSNNVILFRFFIKIQIKPLLFSNFRVLNQCHVGLCWTDMLGSNIVSRTLFFCFEVIELPTRCIITNMIIFFILKAILQTWLLVRIFFITQNITLFFYLAN